MKISIIIPVLNEAERLPAFIAWLRKTSDAEIIVSDGGSTDGSFELAQKIADSALRSSTGRARQMHQGALAASGDLFLFLHADTHLPDIWQSALLAAWMRKPVPAATAFNIRFEPETLYYRFIALTARWRNFLTGIPQGDQAIGVLKEIYFKAGGFPDVPLMEEYFLLSRLKKYGHIRILKERAATSVRRYEKRTLPILGSFKNNLIVILHYCGVPPQRLAKLYR